jgi:hypothetical protein
MPVLNESHTFVMVRGDVWTGEVTSEPVEGGWAREAVIFLRPLRVEGAVTQADIRVQVSPDGMRWADEGSRIPLGGAVDEVTFARIGHFGNWLRLKARLPEGASCQMLATLHLKG